MKVFFRISLVLFLGFISLSTISASQAVPTSLLSQHPILEQLKQDNSFRKECFLKVDLESLASCKHRISQDQSDFEAWNQLGRIYYELESYEEAYLSFQYATSLQSDYAIAWANTCAALNRLQDYEGALSACNKSLDLSSISESSVDERFLAWHNKAIVLYFLGRYQESLDALDKTLSIKPDNLEAKLNRIFVLHALAHNESSKSNNLTL
ncbi:MAG: tetratricopeptide repeat protein [Cyanobacteria bacterium P01_F01_bin.86]